MLHIHSKIEARLRIVFWWLALFAAGEGVVPWDNAAFFVAMVPVC